LAEKAQQTAPRIARKAWRFAGEMEEIASTLRDRGLPDGFHTAAGKVYRRLAMFKNAPVKPTFDEVIATLCQSVISEDLIEPLQES
jgi:hypothetical protein